MASYSYSPQLFIQGGPSTATKLASAASRINEFVHFMSKSADSINSAIEMVNSEASDDCYRVKTELVSCRDNYLKVLASSTTFVGRFNKLLKYSNMKNEWKTEMVDSASGGDYTGFSSYITQLVSYLDQCNELYQDFVKSCTDAEARWRGLPVLSRTSIASESPAIAKGSFIPAMLIGAGTIGCITMGLMAKLLDYHAITRIGLELAAALLIITAEGVLCTFLVASKNNIVLQNRIEYQGYSISTYNIRNPVNADFTELRNSLMSMSAKPGFSTISSFSFQSALDAWLEEVERSIKIVQQCYEKLNEQISIVQVNF